MKEITFSQVPGGGGHYVFPPGPCGQLKGIPDAYIDVVLTSPAYNLGSPTYHDCLPPEQYWSEVREMFEGVRRVLKPEGVCAVDVAGTFMWAGRRIDAKREFTRIAREANLHPIDRERNYHYNSTSRKGSHGHSQTQYILLFRPENSTPAREQLPPGNPFRRSYAFGQGGRPEEWWPNDLVDDLVSVFCPDVREREETPILLDPFMGSGLVGLRACRSRWRFIGYEREPRLCSRFKELAQFEFGAEYHALEEGVAKEIRSLRHSGSIPDSLDLHYIGAFLYDYRDQSSHHLHERVDHYFGNPGDRKRRAALYENALSETVPITVVLPAIRKDHQSPEVFCLVSRYHRGSDYVINRNRRYPVDQFFREFRLDAHQRASFLRHFQILQKEPEGAFFAFFPVPKRGYPGGKVLTHLTVVGAPFCEEVPHSFRNTIVHYFLNSATDAVMRRVDTLAGETHIQATRAAAAAILARNMSHHIGSHVTPRTHLDDLRARVEELILPVFRGRETTWGAQRLLAPGWVWGGHASGEPALGSEELITMLDRRDPPRRWQFDDWELKAFPILKELRDTLDDYTQRKSEFIAEFSTDPLISTRAASFYREVILPFVRNTALTDTLVANEGFRYVRDTQPGLIVRCFVAPPGKGPEGWRNAEEIQAVFHPEGIAPDKEPGELWRHPPYGMRFASDPDRDGLTDVRSGPDPRVALPGPVGEMAFYGILENIIRNAAKHGIRRGEDPTSKGKPDPDAWEPLEVHVVLRDEGPEQDCYRVRVYENLSGKPPEGNDQVLETLREFAKKPIIDETGQPRKEAWGTAEMALCASVLRGIRPGSGEDGGLDVDAGETVQPFIKSVSTEPLRFVYSFSIRKACTAVFFGFDEESERVGESLRQMGFRFAPVSRLFERENRELPPAFQFAVLNAGALGRIAAEEKTDEAIRLASKRIPFRVLVCGTSAEHADSVSRTLSALRARFISDAPPFVTGTQCADDLANWLWQSWLGRLTESQGGTRTASLDVYFHQDSQMEPTASWAKHADTHNARIKTGIPAPSVRVWARSGDGHLRCVTSKSRDPQSGEMRVVVDRHGMLVSDSHAYKPSPNDCVMVIDKSSSDFDALYNASFAAPWSLPYEIAEAGMLRILVVDERIVQRACDWYPAAEKGRDAFRLAMTGSIDEAPRLYHVAQRAGIFIATHIGIEGAGKSDGSLDLAHRHWASQPVLDSANVRQLRFNASASADSENPIDVAFCPRFPDLVVLHQGVVDLVRDRAGADTAKAFLTTLAAKCWTVIESGRGIPQEVKESSEKFLSFSLIEHAFHGKQVAKLGLVRQLMEVTRNRTT